ncbi:GtrA-like protein [Rhodovulum sp. PH10]|uniref:GtrA family protein n=1 Tax=Rhodovulum sp. PH10 TaxID=1187851 RepID=UPI00027C2E3E|nr:GtrA family protein [Rhodovulum sp. PH10]EJW10430.1 GtrA-like protein [Rhodovulum sp. PH10]
MKTTLDTMLARAAPVLRQKLGVRLPMLRKALSFALIGVVNTLVDASVFFLAYGMLTGSPAALDLFSAMATRFGFGEGADLALIVANLMGWMVGVTGSYLMNSTITFAAESGRKLRLRDYGTFVASGVLGAIGNTTTLVLVAQVMPVWVAKASAILVSFVLNFTMSHFVVFRPRKSAEQARS